MWIRSLNKEILIKAVCIYLCGENHICASTVEGDRWYIGKYSTEEKALKMLDMIEKLINSTSNWHRNLHIRRQLTWFSNI